MAGRLGMSIDEIKEAYQTFAKQVFSGSKSGASARLENSVKNIVKKYTEPEDAEARLLSGPPAKSGVQCNLYVLFPSVPMFFFFSSQSYQICLREACSACRRSC